MVLVELKDPFLTSTTPSARINGGFAFFLTPRSHPSSAEEGSPEASSGVVSISRLMDLHPPSSPDAHFDPMKLAVHFRSRRKAHTVGSPQLPDDIFEKHSRIRDPL